MRAVFYYGRVIKQHWRNNKAIIEAPSRSTVGIISLRANLYIYFPLSAASHNAIAKIYTYIYTHVRQDLSDGMWESWKLTLGNFSVLNKLFSDAARICVSECAG